MRHLPGLTRSCRRCSASANRAEVRGAWNGQWTTVIEGHMSVCGCTYHVPPGGSSKFTIDVIAGPIFNNDDAKVKAPIACASYGGTWNGQWKTVVEGKMSVCGCTFSV